MGMPTPPARGPVPRGLGGGRRVGYLAVLLAGRLFSILSTPLGRNHDRIRYSLFNSMSFTRHALAFSGWLVFS